jgi:hypothetical protein
MPNDNRLKHLIEEAKAHQQEQHDEKLNEFRSSLEDAISTELCNVLGMTYSIGKPGMPTATFLQNNETWTIRHGGEGVERWKWAIRRNGRVITSGQDGFNTKDELLLLIDESTL